MDLDRKSWGRLPFLVSVYLDRLGIFLNPFIVGGPQLSVEGEGDHSLVLSSSYYKHKIKIDCS